MKVKEKEALLANYRVLDLTDEKGFLCGQILALLGAEVILIEKPGGSPAQNIGPFYQDAPDPERSLLWLAFNTNKKGITLDIETQEGKDIFKKLVEKVDFVIESFSPGYMDNLGLGYSELSKINPSLIMVSITPFGQTGPYKDFKACDLTTLGMGGLMSQCGDGDRAPLRFSVDQWQVGALFAALGALIALHQRHITGKGQLADVSIQEAFLCCNLYNIAFWSVGKQRYKRAGFFVPRGNNTRRGVWECKDGYISWILFTAALGRRTRALVNWMREEGVAGELKDVNWEAIDLAKVTQEEIDHWENLFAPFFLRHTKKEFQDEAVKRKMILTPLATIEGLVNNPQLSAYDFWENIPCPELGTSLLYPGRPFHSQPPQCKLKRYAPFIGEHNDEIYMKELRIPLEELAELKSKGVV